MASLGGVFSLAGFLGTIVIWGAFGYLGYLFFKFFWGKDK